MGRRRKPRASTGAGSRPARRMGTRDRNRGRYSHVTGRNRHRRARGALTLVVGDSSVVRAVARTGCGAARPAGRQLVALAAIAQRRNRLAAALLRDYQNLADTDPVGFGDSVGHFGIVGGKDHSSRSDKRGKRYRANRNPRRARISFARQSVQASPPRRSATPHRKPLAFEASIARPPAKKAVRPLNRPARKVFRSASSS